MKNFSFRCVNGDIANVKAEDEATARHLVMVSRWGPPTGMYGYKHPLSDEFVYQGNGLDLLTNQGGNNERKAPVRNKKNHEAEPEDQSD